jgi:hypothetical protein
MTKHTPGAHDGEISTAHQRGFARSLWTSAVRRKSSRRLPFRRTPRSLTGCPASHSGSACSISPLRRSVAVTAAAPGAVFGLGHSQADRPPNVVKRAARMIRLLVDATATQVIR